MIEAQCEDAPVGTLAPPAVLLDLLREATDDVFTKMVTKVAVMPGAHVVSMPPAEVLNCADEGGVATEAVVGFSGVQRGAVVLRCSVAGALEITRGLLMLGKGDCVEFDDVEDALRECANMVSGALKSRAFDTIGTCTLHLPRIGSFASGQRDRHLGTIVYRLVEGCAALEIWIEDGDAT